MLTFEQAMEAAKAGKILRLVDDGKGFQLPGIVYAMPAEFLHVIADIAISGTDLHLSAAQLLLVNVFHNSDKSVGMRFYPSIQFSASSMWTYADKYKVDNTEHCQTNAEPAMLPIMIDSKGPKS